MEHQLKTLLIDHSAAVCLIIRNVIAAKVRSYSDRSGKLFPDLRLPQEYSKLPGNKADLKSI